MRECIGRSTEIYVDAFDVDYSDQHNFGMEHDIPKLLKRMMEVVPGKQKGLAELLSAPRSDKRGLKINQPQISRWMRPDNPQQPHGHAYARIITVAEQLGVLTRQGVSSEDVAASLSQPKVPSIVSKRESKGSESLGGSSETKPSQSTLHTIPRSELMGDIDLPVFAMVAGGKGVVILGNEPFTNVARPRRLIGRRHGYGVQVIGDSMAREYNEGDIAFVDPNLPPRKGDPCVFQGTREDGTVEAIIKYLERSPDASETVFYVSQTNPPKKFTLKKADWQKCHVAVGKESGR